MRRRWLLRCCSAVTPLIIKTRQPSTSTESARQWSAFSRIRFQQPPSVAYVSAAKTCDAIPLFCPGSSLPHRIATLMPPLLATCRGTGPCKHERDALTPGVRTRGPPRYLTFRSLPAQQQAAPRHVDHDASGLRLPSIRARSSPPPPPRLACQQTPAVSAARPASPLPFPCLPALLDARELPRYRVSLMLSGLRLPGGRPGRTR